MNYQSAKAIGIYGSKSSESLSKYEGVGYDRGLQQERARMFEDAKYEFTQINRAFNQFDFLLIEEISRYKSVTKISASGGGQWGPLSANAGGSSAMTKMMNKYNLYVLAVNTHSVPRTLQEEAIDYYNSIAGRFYRQNKMSDFQTQFGDSIINEIFVGGQQFVLLEISINEESEKSKVMGDLGMSYGSVFSGSGDFSQKIERSKYKTRMKFHYFDSIERKILESNDLNAVSQTINAFDKLMSERVNYSFLGFDTKEISQLTKLGIKHEQFDWGLVDKRIGFLSEIERRILAYEEWLSDINFVSNSDHFDSAAKSYAVQEKSILEGGLESLYLKAESFRRNPSDEMISDRSYFDKLPMNYVSYSRKNRHGKSPSTIIQLPSSPRLK